MPDPTELFIVRHGEAHCNRDQVVGGNRGCTGLTYTGRDQVACLATQLRGHHAERPFDVLYTSPLRRTRETADIIATQLRLAIHDEPDLREQDYGTADGKPWVDVVEAFGGVPALEPHRPIAAGAETWTRYLRRATKALNRVLTRHAGQRILIIGHGETIDASFRLLLNLAATSRGRAGFAARHASLTHWAQHPVALTRPHAGWRWTLCVHNAVTVQFISLAHESGGRPREDRGSERGPYP
ncbi:MAG: histidine phosphatase family protein [Micromonosporaceae bacterium]